MSLGSQEEVNEVYIYPGEEFSLLSRTPECCPQFLGNSHVGVPFTAINSQHLLKVYSSFCFHKRENIRNYENRSPDPVPSIPSCQPHTHTGGFRCLPFYTACSLKGLLSSREQGSSAIGEQLTKASLCLSLAAGGITEPAGTDSLPFFQTGFMFSVPRVALIHLRTGFHTYQQFPATTWSHFRVAVTRQECEKIVSTM